MEEEEFVGVCSSASWCACACASSNDTAGLAWIGALPLPVSFSASIPCFMSHIVLEYSAALSSMTIIIQS